MYNQNPKTMKDFPSYTSDLASLLYYKDPKDEWERCSVVWANGELAYYSPLLPNAYPIPPIPFRLENSNHYWANYMLDTGVRHPDKIKDLIKKYGLATVKYDKYQVIPSTEYNIQRLERLLTVQFLLFSTAVEKEINAEDAKEKGEIGIKLAFSERFQEPINHAEKLKKEVNSSLKNRTTKTKEPQNQETKADIDTAINSTDIDKNTVKLAEKWVFNKARLLYDCTIGYSYLPSKQNEKMANRSHDRRYSPHTAYLYRLGKINLIRKILSEVDLIGGYSEDSLATWFAGWQSSEAKNWVASYLKIRIGDSPVKFLNAVLKKLGLKATGKRVRTGNILATRYSVEYPADFPLTDLVALFARWHESDRLKYGGDTVDMDTILINLQSFESVPSLRL